MYELKKVRELPNMVSLSYKFTEFIQKLQI